VGSEGDESAVDPEEDLLEWVAVSLNLELVRMRAYVAKVKYGEVARVGQGSARSSPPLACQSMDSLGAKQSRWCESAMFPMLSTPSTASLA